jgi:hypothetical protein
VTHASKWSRLNFKSLMRSPELCPLKWKGMEATPEREFFVRSGPGTEKLGPESGREYIRTRFDAPKFEN